VDEQPDDPPGETGELQPPHGHHGAAAGEVGGRAQVVVAERLGRGAPGEFVPDAAPGVGIKRSLTEPKPVTFRRPAICTADSAHTPSQRHTCAARRGKRTHPSG
jgi:hypothetical protein